MRFLIFILFFLNSCIITSLTRPDNLTPEQIKAYGDAGYDVYGCFKISGPPPIGGLTILTFPKGTKTILSFSSNCELLKAETKT